MEWVGEREGLEEKRVWLEEEKGCEGTGGVGLEKGKVCEGLEGGGGVGGCRGGKGCEGKVKWGWREGVGLEGAESEEGMGHTTRIKLEI